MDPQGRCRLSLDLFLRETRRHYGEAHVRVGTNAVFVRGERIGGKLEPLPDTSDLLCQPEPFWRPDHVAVGDQPLEHAR